MTEKSKLELSSDIKALLLMALNVTPTVYVYLKYFWEESKEVWIIIGMFLGLCLTMFFVFRMAFKIIGKYESTIKEADRRNHESFVDNVIADYEGRYDNITTWHVNKDIRHLYDASSKLCASMLIVSILLFMIPHLLLSSILIAIYEVKITKVLH